jgi:hypothetical protein
VEVSVMMDLNVTLDFRCCGCDHPVTVTVHCTGGSLRQRNLASVNVPCPTCGEINELFFEPTGEVRSVRPYACFRAVPEPSAN